MRIDERDTMFSRMSLTQDSPNYISYYEGRGDLREDDDRRRAMPQLGSVGTTTFDQINSPMMDAAFHFLGDIKHLADGPPRALHQAEADAETFTRRLKGLAMHYGAVLTGVAKLDESYYYSYRGRQGSSYGDSVSPQHAHTFVFAVEMSKEFINSAPQFPEALAVTKGYVDAAVIGMILTYYIKALGYEARNHMDGNYLVVLPLAARAAGLGDIGRNGLLVTEAYGPRIRLGAVSTTMPLLADRPSDFDIKPFCELCKKCVRTCPAKAISGDSAVKRQSDGGVGWQINQENCYEKWRILGTDCGVCLSTCPFSEGLPIHMVENYKKNANTANELLSYHNELYPIRPFNKEKPDWLK